MKFSQKILIFHKNDHKNEYSQIYWIKILFSKCSQRKKSACKIGTFKRFGLLKLLFVKLLRGVFRWF